MRSHTLKRNAEGVPKFLSGREFSNQEIQEIQETVRVYWRLSRKELVQTICEHLDWVTPAGRNKLASCAKASSTCIVTIRWATSDRLERISDIF